MNLEALTGLEPAPLGLLDQRVIQFRYSASKLFKEVEYYA